MFDLLSIRKTVQDLASRVRESKASIEKMKRQREDIANAPAAKSDIKAHLTQLVEQRSKIYETSFRKQMERFVRSPARINDATIMRQDLLISAAPDPGQMANMLHAEFGLSALFKEQVLKALHAQVDAMDWPVEGMPATERAKAMKDLDESISKSERELAELLSSARAAGIAIDA